MAKLLDYDVVVIWAYDRLQRNRKKFLELMQLYSVKGTRIYSFREQWIEELHKVPTPWNEIIYNMMMQIIGWMAENESQHRSERTKARLFLLTKDTPGQDTRIVFLQNGTRLFQKIIKKK